MQTIQEFEQEIKARVITVFALVHTGLAVALFGAGRFVAANGFDSASITILSGVILLYAGVLFGTFFIVWPMLPWIRKAREVRNWAERLMHEIPTIITVVQQILVTWHEFKKTPVPAKTDPSRER